MLSYRPFLCGVQGCRGAPLTIDVYDGIKVTEGIMGDRKNTPLRKYQLLRFFFS